MNYQNNMDAYYAYAKENRKVDRTQRKNTFIWFLLSLLILLLVWAYLSSWNTNNTESLKSTLNGTDTSTVALVDNVNEKVPTGLFPFDAEVAVSPVNTKGIGCPIGKSERAPQLCTASTKVTGTPSDATSLLLEKPSQSVIATVESTNALNNENALIALLKVSDANSSGSQVSLLDESTKTKVEVQEKLPMDLYHLYIVSKGESMYDIAEKQYGDTGMYINIVNANPDLTDPDNIREGQEIFLPIIDESKSYSDILNFK